VSEWDSDSLLYSVTQHQIGNFTVQRSPHNVPSYEAIVETTEQSCEAVSVLYDVDVTFPRGIQTIQHFLSDVRALPKKVDIFGASEGHPNPNIVLDLPPDPQALQDWHQKTLAALPISNEWALLNSLGDVLEGKFYENSQHRYPDMCQKRNNPNNATEIHYCWGWENVKIHRPANHSGELHIPI
jgi:hypothetical protein